MERNLNPKKKKHEIYKKFNTIEDSKIPLYVLFIVMKHRKDFHERKFQSTNLSQLLKILNSEDISNVIIFFIIEDKSFLYFIFI
jgi:hypothetical protein